MMNNIDNAKVLAIYNTQGKLPAVKYLHDAKYGQLKACLEYVEDLVNKRNQQTGTITWFLCDESQPPPNPDDLRGYSIDVLLTTGEKTEIGSYCHGLNGGSPHWHSTYACTHWAYINLPND